MQISAIILQPQNPFVWASGWNSPIYTDNRRALSYPDVRNFIKVEFARVILENYPEVEAIAGVANGGIAFGAIVADVLGLPYSYIRSTPKDHGLENLVEGNLRPGQKVVVLEDLVSTGGSSMRTVETVRNSGCEVLGVAALFNYEFPMAIKRLRNEDINLVALLDYNTMLEAALDIHYITADDVETLKEWRKDPANWV